MLFLFYTNAGDGHAKSCYLYVKYLYSIDPRLKFIFYIGSGWCSVFGFLNKLNKLGNKEITSTVENLVKTYYEKNSDDKFGNELI